MKPKIYGHCAAGCEFETVHKDDYDAHMTLFPKWNAPSSEITLTEAGWYFVEFTYLGSVYTLGLVYYDGSFPFNRSFTLFYAEGAILSVQIYRYVESSDVKFEVRLQTTDMSVNEDKTSACAFKMSRIMYVSIPSYAEEASF